MRSLTVFFLAATSFLQLKAQTKIEKRLAVKPEQKVNMHFDYPELIKVSTWDGDEILVEGTVDINNGENDSAFELKTSQEGNLIIIKSLIKDFDNLPRKMTIVQNGKKLIFNSKKEFKEYSNGHPSTYDMTSFSVDMEIKLSIKVPANMETTVESIYGMVEVANFNGTLTVNATYGGTDVSIQETSVGQLTASTNYGEIYSNLTKKFEENHLREEDFHTEVNAVLGKGPRYKLDSQYGNVYLRKASPN